MPHPSMMQFGRIFNKINVFSSFNKGNKHRDFFTFSIFRVGDAVIEHFKACVPGLTRSCPLLVKMHKMFLLSLRYKWL